MTARAALAVVLLLLASPVGPEIAAAAGSAGGCDDCVKAGAAAVPLRVPPGAPLAGYGSAARRLLVPDVLGRHPHAFWFKPAQGALDPLAARALVLEGNGARLAWVAVDLVAVDRSFTRALERALVDAGVRPATLIVSASHTHSGPGAFIDSALMAAVNVDRYDPDVRAALVGSVVEAIRRADATKAPARAGAVSVEGPPLTASRLGQPLDAEIVVVKVARAAGTPIALVWNYAIHGTMLGPRNLRWSADVMGVTSRTLERDLGVPALFVNGALGDVSPRHHGVAASLRDGAELAAAVRAAWERVATDPAARLAVRTARVDLPPAFLPLRNCLGRWVPRAVRLPLDGALPRDAELTAAALGDTAWVAVPGELASRLGVTIKHEARRAWAHAFVAGVSNDYLGYFVAPEDWERVAYVTCASLYGPEAGGRLTAAASRLLLSLRGRRAAAPRVRGAATRDGRGAAAQR